MAKRCEGINSRYALGCKNMTASRNGLCHLHQTPEVKALREIDRISSIVHPPLHFDLDAYRKRFINISRIAREALRRV